MATEFLSVISNLKNSYDEVSVIIPGKTRDQQDLKWWYG